jgi:NAD(P)-dependent dehydrogenase (short-subunit alcohol dehydrogenase family)
MLLQDKVVVITGVGPGLGRSLSRSAASAGASVLCVARTESFVNQVADEIRAEGGVAVAVPGDVTSRADCERIAHTAEREFGRLDGLVNSAFSVGALGAFPDVDLDDWRQAIEVNFFGALQLIQCVLPLMERGGGGSIVNINTMSSARPMKGQGAYGASKAALEFATRQLAVDLGGRGIRCNTVYCGPMRGPNLDDAMEKWAERRGVTFEEIVDAVSAVIAQGSIPEDADVAPAILLLLSDAAGVINGTSYHATGGAFVEHRV